MTKLKLDIFFSDLFSDLKQRESSSKANVVFNFKELVNNHQIKILSLTLFGKEISNNSLFSSKLKELVVTSRDIIANTYKEMFNMSFLLNVRYLQAFKVQRELIKLCQTNLTSKTTEKNGHENLRTNMSLYEYFMLRNKRFQFPEISINNVITELLFAGTDTIVITVNSLVLYATLELDIQEAIQSELDKLDVLKVGLSCRKQCPFTHACILETLR